MAEGRPQGRTSWGRASSTKTSPAHTYTPTSHTNGDIPRGRGVTDVSSPPDTDDPHPAPRRRRRHHSTGRLANGSVNRNRLPSERNTTQRIPLTNTYNIPGLEQHHQASIRSSQEYNRRYSPDPVGFVRGTPAQQTMPASYGRAVRPDDEERNFTSLPAARSNTLGGRSNTAGGPGQSRYTPTPLTDLQLYSLGSQEPTTPLYKTVRSKSTSNLAQAATGIAYSRPTIRVNRAPGSNAGVSIPAAQYATGPVVSSVAVQPQPSHSSLLPQNEFYGSSKRSFTNHREEHVRCRTLFEDPEFPANDKSLYFSSAKPQKHFKWLRPHEIAGQHRAKPQLFDESSQHRFNLVQGELGDCWITAALATMAQDPSLLSHVIPADQSFQPGWYGGIFHFMFWRSGEWEEVIIDDRLPTVDGQLVFVHSQCANEFWGALFEKAYAKLQGSYEALRSGQLADALHDLTGGLVESYQVDSNNQQLISQLTNIIFSAIDHGSLVTCAVNPKDKDSSSTLRCGLLIGHAYSIVDIKEIQLVVENKESSVVLIKMRDPWNARSDWNGSWGTRSHEWTSINDDDKTALGLQLKYDGEFWLTFKDFVKYFDTIALCHILSDKDDKATLKWSMDAYSGRWRKGVNSGGRPVCKSHWTNPQYCLSLTQADKGEPTCTVLVELMQCDRRRLRQKGIDTVDIGFIIYEQVTGYLVPLTANYFDHHKYIERCDYYTNYRQICKRFMLPVGRYVVIPTTYQPDTEADYMIRVFFENEENKLTVAEDIPEVVDVGLVPTDPRRQEHEIHYKETFYQLSGENMEVDVFEFHRLLNECLAKESGFDYNAVSLDSCRALLALVDLDRSGLIGYYEFLYSVSCIKSWMKTFSYYDRHQEMRVHGFDLRKILKSIGYFATNAMVNSLMLRFADDQQMLGMDAFIQLMARLQNVHNLFKMKAKTRRVHLTLEQLLEEISLL